MSKCTDKSDDAFLLSSSNNTAAVDDMSKGIEKVTLVDVDNSPPCDISSSREEDNMNSEKKFTSCEQKLEHIKTDEINHNSASSDANTTTDRSGDIVSGAGVSLCANCGKEGANNTCNKCKQVKYCNAVCKKVHKKKHKKDCEEHLKRLAELQEEENKRAAELYDIELFKLTPQEEDDCPICFLRLPYLNTGRTYQSCCGKVMCSGCIHAMDKICPFCRTPTPRSHEEIIRRIMKRVEMNDAKAINYLGSYYYTGDYSLLQDYGKALELWHRAAELGHFKALFNIGVAYYNGRGVNRDSKKAIQYFELAAMKGSSQARHNLGAMEQKVGNTERSLKHFMIAVEGGNNGSLKAIQNYYSNGQATKDDYKQALQAYQKYLDEVKSSQRDEAAASREDYQYID